MITPISNNFNTSKSLKPVEVPHFTGSVKVVKKGTASSKKLPVKSINSKSISGISFNKKAANDVFTAAGRGAKKGIGAVKDALVFSGKFLVAFGKSFYQDAKLFATSKASKSLDIADTIIG